MMSLRVWMMWVLLLPIAAAMAHPGHLASSPDHVHGALDVDPFMATLLIGVAITVTVLLVRRSSEK